MRERESYGERNKEGSFAATASTPFPHLNKTHPFPPQSCPSPQTAFSAAATGLNFAPNMFNFAPTGFAGAIQGLNIAPQVIWIGACEI